MTACFICNLKYKTRAQGLYLDAGDALKLILFLGQVLATTACMETCQTRRAKEAFKVVTGLSTLVTLTPLPLPGIEPDLTLAQMGV